MVHPAFFFVPAVAALSIAFVAGLRGGAGYAPKLFIFGLLLLALESAFMGFAAATPGAAAMRFHNLGTVVAGFLPGIWLAFGLSYSRGNFRSFLRQWSPLLLALLVLPAGLVLFVPQLTIALEPRDGVPAFYFSWGAVVIHSSIIVGAVLLLMNLERTFKASVGTMRWNIKFTLLGLLVIFGVRIYTSSQIVLYRSATLYLELFNSAALFLGSLLLARSLTRASSFRVDVYPSEKVLQSSITAIFAGAYLLLVGVFARVVTWVGGDSAFPIKAFFIILALAGLAVLLVSDRLRQRFHDLVVRNFARPRYDYRSVWLTLTERTASIIDPRQLSEALAATVSETLRALSVTVWLTDHRRVSFERTASTCFTAGEARSLDASKEAGILEQIARFPNPFFVDELNEEWTESLSPYYLDQFKEQGGRRVCVPLISRGLVVGMITLGDRVSGAPYGLEELDLLKCVADQFASSLLNLRLSSDLIKAKEMEAFQTMAAFFVHDLKNTASSLGLMLQNFRAHIDKPEFREDALRAIAKATNHIHELIQRLSAVRGQLVLHPQSVSIEEVIRSSAECLKPRNGVSLTMDLKNAPPIFADSAQLQKVFTNLFLNASEAMKDRGEIRVEACQKSGYAIVSVADQGCGMSADYLKNQLFRPFQSTKKGGLGIGMFHSKMIVEAHQGRLEVESEVSHGTTFRLFLPILQPGNLGSASSAKL